MIYKISVLDSQGWLDYKITNDIDRMYFYVRELVKNSEYDGLMVKEYSKYSKEEKIILLKSLSRNRKLLLRRKK